jgi:2-haloacid dehalogenase
MMSGPEVFRTTLESVREQFGYPPWSEEEVVDILKSWEGAEAWGDSAAGLEILRSKFIVYVKIGHSLIPMIEIMLLDRCGLSNGATLQTIKINRRNHLEFDTLLLSDVIGAYKPNEKMYKTALKAMLAEKTPGELAMVAAHAYDCEAARKWWVHLITTHHINTLTLFKWDEDNIHPAGYRRYGY